MIKADLPVILLRGMILLPQNDIRLEFDKNDTNIIDVSEMFHDNKLLVVSALNPLEEGFDVKDYTNIGIVSEIIHKLELPNGKLRVVIRGIKRANINEYLNLNHNNETLEAIIEEQEEIIDSEEQAYIHKLYYELENYIHTIPYMSNSVLSQIINIQSLSNMTDIVVPYMPISYDKMLLFLNEFDPKKRMEMILQEIVNEKEMFEIEKKIDNKVKNEIDNTQKEYLLREKMKYIKEELGEVSSKNDEIEELKSEIDKLNANDNIKEYIKKELKKYENMNISSPETNIQNNYIHWLLDLPWNNKTEDEKDLNKVKLSLDESHSGLEDVKLRIIEYLAVKKMTNSLNGPILCLVGPPGVGKTTLAKSIAEAMGRKFVKMSVGGCNDEAEITGHRRAYVGANPGRIISSMKKAKSNNPVFLIDEIDKMTSSVNGDPASALLEVLDPEQNKYFSDNYIELEYDLSNVLFITTANYIENIPEPLKDRLEIVTLNGYTEYEKLDIAKKHLIPNICLSHGLDSKLLTFEDSAILKIIREYTKESGVRELEREISTIIRKLVTKIVLKEDINFNIKDNTLNEYLGKSKYLKTNKIKGQIGIVNGLCYTYFGGDVLPIEVNYYKGCGELVLTGSLGNVMKESAQIAFSFVKSNYKKFNIPYYKLMENDIHIHVPEGAVPKDGPSAGITLTSAIISALSHTKIDETLAMTGEITLRGNVLAIGGLKEKSIGAHRNNIKKIIIPYDNKRDIEDLPDIIKKDMTFIPVKTYYDVWNIIKEMHN